MSSVADIIALAQQKAREAVEGNSTTTSRGTDPEVEARKEARAKEKAERNHRIIEMYSNADLDDKEVKKSIFDTIAAEVGIGKQTVVNVLVDAGAYVPRKRHTKEDFDKVADYFREGMTKLAEVVDASGYEYAYVRQVAIKLGVDYDSQRGRMDPEKIPDIVQRALDLEEFAGVSILTIGQFLHKLKKEASGETENVKPGGKKRGRPSKAELAAREAAANEAEGDE